MLEKPTQPIVSKRVIAFFDVQNLYRTVLDVFGYTHPNFDPVKLSELICRKHIGWDLRYVYFYTGYPEFADNPKWNKYWISRFSEMGRDRRIILHKRHLRYRDEQIQISDGVSVTRKIAREKGIDVKIALDIVSFARMDNYDVGLIFSQDQDLSAVVPEVDFFSKARKSNIELYSAFPFDVLPRKGSFTNFRGIDKTTWVKISKSEYDLCIDPKDYFRTHVNQV